MRVIEQKIRSLHHSTVFLWLVSAFFHIFSFFWVCLCHHFVCFSPVSRPCTQILSLFILAAILNKFPLSWQISHVIFAVCQGLLSCCRHIGKREDPGREVPLIFYIYLRWWPPWRHTVVWRHGAFLFLGNIRVKANCHPNEQSIHEEMFFHRLQNNVYYRWISSHFSCKQNSKHKNAELSILAGEDLTPKNPLERERRLEIQRRKQQRWMETAATNSGAERTSLNEFRKCSQQLWKLVNTLFRK